MAIEKRGENKMRYKNTSAKSRSGSKYTKARKRDSEALENCQWKENDSAMMEGRVVAEMSKKKGW